MVIASSLEGVELRPQWKFGAHTPWDARHKGHLERRCDDTEREGSQHLRKSVFQEYGGHKKA
jgi:hypothetical protein